jgi:hypothetical protein
MSDGIARTCFWILPAIMLLWVGVGVLAWLYGGTR